MRDWMFRIMSHEGRWCVVEFHTEAIIFDFENLSDAVLCYERLSDHTMIISDNAVKYIESHLDKRGKTFEVLGDLYFDGTTTKKGTKLICSDSDYRFLRFKNPSINLLRSDAKALLKEIL